MRKKKRKWTKQKESSPWRSGTIIINKRDNEKHTISRRTLNSLTLRWIFFFFFFIYRCIGAIHGFVWCKPFCWVCNNFQVRGSFTRYHFSKQLIAHCRGHITRFENRDLWKSTFSETIIFFPISGFSCYCLCL